jgi:radical SAM superfamily enzyme YgiQ (UPF0313 family)
VVGGANRPPRLNNLDNLTMASIDVAIMLPARGKTFRHSIAPSYPYFEPWSLEPLTLASCLRERGFSVSYFPLYFLENSGAIAKDVDACKKWIKENRATIYLLLSDLYIASRSTSTALNHALLAQEVRRAHPESCILAAGRLPTNSAQLLLREISALDGVVVGDPFASVPAVVRSLVSGRAPSLLTYVSRRIDHSPVTSETEYDGFEIEDLPAPAVDLLRPWLVYCLDHAPWLEAPIPLTLRTSYGCVFNCSFCGGIPEWNNVKVKTYEQIERDILIIQNSLKDIGRLSFLDDELLTLFPKHVNHVSTILSSHGIMLDGLYTHSRFINDDIAKALSTFTRQVHLGLDSLNNDILEKMGKHQQLKTVTTAASLLRQHGIRVHLELIVGLPEDTVESSMKQLYGMYVLLRTGLIDTADSYVFCPHPGTKYGEAISESLNNLDVLSSMIESGGYPPIATKHVSRQQIFIIYLLSQLCIKEVVGHPKARKIPVVPKFSDPTALVELLRQFENGG